MACGATAQGASDNPAAPAVAQQAPAQEQDDLPPRNAVYPVNGKATEVARVLMETLRGTVIATPMGGSVVVSGDQAAIAQAQELIAQLNEVVAREQLKLLNERDRIAAEHQRANDERERALALEWEAKNRVRAESRIFDVTFGPTLGDSLHAISKAVASDDTPGINIVFAGDGSLAQLPVRAVSLKQVSMWTAVTTLEGLLSTAEGGPVSISFVARNTSRPPTQTSEQQKPVIMVERHALLDARAQAFEPIVGVFRLQGISGLDSDEDRDEVAREHTINMDAIEAGLEVIGRSESFQMKLHPETGILFVKGTPDEIRLVADVLDMPVPAHAAGTVPPAPPAAPTPPSAPAAPTRPAHPTAPSEPAAPAPPAPPQAPAARTPAAR